MKHRHSSSHQQPPASAVLTAAPDAGKSEILQFPSPDQIAKRAYFTYLNEGSLPGRDEQHWLDAEAQLRADRSAVG